MQSGVTQSEGVRRWGVAYLNGLDFDFLCFSPS